MCRESEIFQTSPSAGGGCPCHSPSHNHEEKLFADFTDSTGAPSYNYRSIIPADFFYAGHLYIAFKEAIGSIIRLKTQTSWQVVITKDHAIKAEKGQSIVFFSKGVIDRNYAGFDISEFIYQRIVKSWSLFHQYRVHRTQPWKGKGFRFFNDGQVVTKDVSHDIERIILQTEMTYSPEEIMAFLPDNDLQEMYLENQLKEV